VKVEVIVTILLANGMIDILFFENGSRNNKKSRQIHYIPFLYFTFTSFRNSVPKGYQRKLQLKLLCHILRNSTLRIVWNKNNITRANTIIHSPREKGVS